MIATLNTLISVLRLRIGKAERPLSTSVNRITAMSLRTLGSYTSPIQPRRGHRNALSRPLMGIIPLMETQPRRRRTVVTKLPTNPKTNYSPARLNVPGSLISPHRWFLIAVHFPSSFCTYSLFQYLLLLIKDSLRNGCYRRQF